MGPGLESRAGLELGTVPRLATPGWPVAGELGTLGSPTTVGIAAAAPAAVGTRGQRDVEPDFGCLGILEQRQLDADLTKRPVSIRGSRP